jgi:hypothetical protein
VKYKVVSALSFLISANVYAGDDAWEVDARYSYYQGKNDSSYSYPVMYLSGPSNSSNSSSYKRTDSSLNLTLNDTLDENASVHGVFTLDNLISNTASRPTTKKVRQLYLTHKLENGTEIKLGKRAAPFDRTKGIQELGARCDTSLDIICTGVQSLSINTPLDKNTELQVLASEFQYSWLDRKHYTARVKRSTSDADYYLKLGRNDNLSSNPYYNHHSLGLSVELPDKENPKDKWYAEYEHAKFNGKPSYMSVLSEAVCGNNYSSSSSSTYSKNNKLNSLGFGRAASIDKLLIRANMSYAKESGDIISDRTYCEGETPMRSSANIGHYHRMDKTATLMLEYPIPSGKIIGWNSYSNRNFKSVEFSAHHDKYNSMNVMVMLDLSSTLLAKIGYGKSRNESDSSYFNFSNTSSHTRAQTYVRFKYKF